MRIIGGGDFHATWKREDACKSCHTRVEVNASDLRWHTDVALPGLLERSQQHDRGDATARERP
jgi:hypothetical protein